MKSLLLLAATFQYLLPPAPPAQTADGAALERDLSQMAADYRAQCYSDEAIKIMVESSRRARTAAGPDVAAIQATNKELADAAYAQPFDKNRMVLAIRAREKVQADSQRQPSAYEIDILNRLPKADQVRYARSIAGVIPTVPAKTCP